MKNNIQRQNQYSQLLQQQALKEQALQKQESKKGIHFKPVFGVKRKYRIKPLFS